MADISAEIAAFQNAVYGEDVRSALVSLANKLNTVVTNLDSTALVFRGGISTGSDLNNFTTMGTYINGTAQEVPDNVPDNITSSGFILLVFYTNLSGYGNYLCQIIIDKNSNYYFRFRASSSWRAWNKLAIESNMLSQIDSVDEKIVSSLTDPYKLTNNKEYEDKFVCWTEGLPPEVSHTAASSYHFIKSVGKYPIDDEMFVILNGSDCNYHGIACYDKNDNLVYDNWSSVNTFGFIYTSSELLTAAQTDISYIILYKEISRNLNSTDTYGHVFYKHKNAMIEYGFYKELYIHGGTIHNSTVYYSPTGNHNLAQCQGSTNYDCFSNIKFPPNSIVTFDTTKVKMLVCFYNIDETTSTGHTFWITTSPCDIEALYPEKCLLTHHIRLEFRKLDDDNSINFTDTLSVEVKKTSTADSDNSLSNTCVYMSTSGSDSNDGLSSANPVKTLSKAMTIGRQIIVMSGDYSDRVPGFSGSLFVRKYSDTGKVRFLNPDRILASSATQVSGYSNVYQISINSDISGGEIYQENVNDVQTLISDNERHPCQRGKEYRCEDTVIIECSSTTLNDALNEIENASAYKYFVDDTTLYFSSPQTIDADHPLTKLTNPGWFLSSSQSQSVKLIGLEFKGYHLNLYACGAGSTAIDCRVGQILGAGCFRWDSSVGTKLIRCEAYRANSGTTTGDGFNAHSTTEGLFDAKKCTCMLVDCWSHDNHDDGYSDHECAEITIHGGLFEHNGKAGITPSYGSHCVCYNVYSRNNYRGFCYTGSASDGGKYGQLAMYSCIAEGNSISGIEVRGDGNRLMAYNCTTIDNPVGYVCYENTYMRLINCYSENDVSKITDTGYVTIETPDLMTPSVLTI